MPTIRMPRKESEEQAVPSRGQGRPSRQRFWLQVDRQTKATYSTLADAEKAGRAIKAAHPIVQVAIYDAEESHETVLCA